MWNPPVVRGTEEGHRQATWAELFFDLIFVVAVAQLATRLFEDVSWSGVALYAFVYLPIWLSWVVATFYANRFDTDDLTQRLITFGQMLMVAAMAASVAEGRGTQFAVSLAVFRLLVAISYLRVRLALPEARALANRMMYLMVVSAGIWLLSTTVEGNVRRAFWAVAIVLELAVPFLPSSRKRMATVPLQLDHLPERFGLFTIIVLGETVLAVVTGVAEAHLVASAAVFGAIGLTMSFSLWWIYFEGVTSGSLGPSGRIRRIGWVLAHAPLVISITALGVGIEEAVLTDSGQTLETSHAVLLSGSLALALLSLGLLMVLENPDKPWIRILLGRFPAIVAVVVIGLLPITAQAVLTGLALVTAAQAISDVRTRRQDLPAQAT